MGKRFTISMWLNLLVVVLISAVVTSCFDNTYDDIEISNEVGLFGNGLTIPVGTTSPMALSDFIDLEDQDGMYLLDGVYTIKQSGDVDHTVDAIKEGGVEIDIDVTPIDVDTQSIALDYNDLTITIPINDAKTTIDIETDLPDQVIELKLADLGDGSILELYIKLEGIEISSGDVSFSDFRVQLPDFLGFAASGYDNALLDANNYLEVDASSATISNPDGKFVADTSEPTTRYWRGQFKVESLDLTKSQYDNVVVISSSKTELIIKDEELSCDGEVVIKDASGQMTDHIGLEIGVDITTLNPNNSNSMVIESVLGEFAVDVDIAPTDVDLGDGLSDDFTITAQLTNPTIELSITNELGIPVELSGFSLNPQDASGNSLLKSLSSVDGIDASGAITVESFVIPAEVTDYKITISVEGGSADNQVDAPALGYLLSQGTPANIEITMDAALEEVSAGDDWHEIELTNSHQLKIEYEVIIPLEFETIYIGMDTSFDGLSSSLSELGDLITNVAFIIEATNTLPLDFNIEEIEPLDEDGNVITSGFEPIISAPVSIASNQTTSFKINLNTGGDADTFATLDGLNLKLSISGEADDSGEGAALSDSDDEYLQFFLKVSLPEGITLNLDDLMDDDDDGDESSSDENVYYDNQGNVYYY